MQTGYFIGSGASQTISGLGFTPQMVIIRSDTAAQPAVWKSSAMPANTTAYFGATANDTTTLITLQSDGFSVSSSAIVNTTNVRYTWTAFSGSDCTASGTFCVGTYTGNGTNPRLITTGFQPNYTMVKRSTAAAGIFRTSSMADNIGQYFSNVAQSTNGSLFTTLAANGFNVGTTGNTNGGVYYHASFKSVPGIMAVGTYTGNGADDRNITGFGSGTTPNLVMIKNATSAKAINRVPVMSTSQHYGDYTSYISTTDVAAPNMIQSLSNNTFQVGSAGTTNENSRAIHWIAWGGAAALPAGSSGYTMANGSYLGDGAIRTITGIGFAPDLVMIKCNNTTNNPGAFRTKLMSGDSTITLAWGNLFTGGITSLDANGFSIGTNTWVNPPGSMCHWQAFGNAYNPVTRSGSTDFAIGAYTSNGIGNQAISAIPWQPDFVLIKQGDNVETRTGVWSTSAHSTGVASELGPWRDTPALINSFGPNGFQVGSGEAVNYLSRVHYWFAFKSSQNFAVGNYTGTGSDRTFSTPVMYPDLTWIKNNWDAQAITKPSTLASDSGQVGSFGSDVPGLFGCANADGIRLLGAAAETNASAESYHYVIWRMSGSTPTISAVDSNGCTTANQNVSFTNMQVSFACTLSTGTMSSAAQKFRIVNTTANPNWSVSIAATDGPNSLWTSGSDRYDFNDGAGSPAGCADGADADSGETGQLTIDPSVGTRTPKSSCSNTGTTLGSRAAFEQGVTNNITLITGNNAPTNCYWDVTGIGLSQRIPPSTKQGTYSLNLTVTVMAN